MKRNVDAIRTDRGFPTEGLYGFVTEELCLNGCILRTAELLGAAGVAILQYREKDKDKKTKLAECRALREITARFGQCFIVNDDIDIALLVGADGVHLGQDDIPACEARSLIGGRMILGISTHSPAQLARALADGADYVGVGPLYSTKTKRNVCAPVGLSYLDHALATSAVPCVAIGGIKRHNLGDVLGRGAKIVAMVTELISCADPHGAARGVIETMEQGRMPT